MSQFFSPRPQPLYPQYPLDPATGISLGDYPYRSIDADGKVFHESERSYKAGPGFPGFHPNNSGLLQLPGQKTFFRIEPYVTTKANWGWNGGPAESTLGLSSKDGTDLARFIKADKLVRYVKAALEQKKKTYAKHKKTLEDFRVTHGDTLSEEIGKPSSGLAASFSKRRNSMRSSSLNSSVARPAFSMPLGGPRLNSLKLGTTQFSVFDTPAVPAAYPDAFNRTTAGRANSFRTATKAPTDFPYPSTPGPRSSQTEDPSRHPRSNSLRNTSSTGKPQLAPVPLPAAPVPVPGSRSGNGLEPIELSLGQPIAPGSGPVDGREFVSPQQRPAQFVGTKSRVAGNYTGVPTAFQPTLGTEEVDPLAMGDHIPTPHVVAPAPTISRPETPLSTRINFLEGYVSSQADTSGIQYSIDELAKLRQLNNASPDSRRIGWLEYEEERGNVAPGSDEKAELDRLKAAKRAAAEAIRDADELAEEAGVKKNSK